MEDIRIGQKVYIRGAGDLATGIGCRLYESGFFVVMTDLEVPTTVRRTVAFSPAVYEGKAVVEGKTAVRCTSLSEIKKAHNKGEIPIVVDSDKVFLKAFQPDIVVDAIIAKKNIATQIDDAKIVIGVGPGFTAGEDCHCVIESMRGHDLGRCIYSGGAAPNTGIPGNIGGFTKERLLRTEAEGIFKGLLEIGDKASANQIIAYAGGSPVRAQIDGIVRGLLQDGVYAHKNMKAGDIDPTGNEEHCHTISDKARAIGGGVLEGILHLSFFS